MRLARSEVIEEFEEELLKKPSVVAFIGPRRMSGKTLTATFVLEELVDSGWLTFIMDPKGEDIGLHKPNVLMRDLLESIGERLGIDLAPRSFPAEYYMVKYLKRLYEIPSVIELAPIALKMVDWADLRTLRGVLRPSDMDLLAECLAAAGEEKATMEGLIEELRERANKVTASLLRFLASGVLDDSSPLEPAKLLSDERAGKFVVLTSGFTDPRSKPVHLFGMRAVFNSLLAYIASRPVGVRSMIWLREIRVIAPRIKSSASVFHSEDFLDELVSSYTQLGGSLTRLGFEAQSTKQVPRPFLRHARILFVNPVILQAEDEVRELRRTFGEIPDDAVEEAERVENKPGLFYMILKEGDWVGMYIPPARSFRVPQAETPEEAKFYEKMLRRTIPFRKLTEEQALREAKYMELVREVFGPDEAMEQVERALRDGLVPVGETDIARWPKVAKYILAMVCLYIVERGSEGNCTIPMRSLRTYLKLITENEKERKRIQIYTAPSSLEGAPGVRKLLSHLGVHVILKEGVVVYVEAKFVEKYLPTVYRALIELGIIPREVAIQVGELGARAVV